MLSADAVPTGDDAEVLDAAALAQLRELDPTGANRLIERVVQAFDVSTSRLLPQLHDAGGSGDLAAARHASHTLKSSSASLGALRLSRLCAELEHQIRSDAVVGLQAQADAILSEAERVRAALSRLVESTR